MLRSDLNVPNKFLGGKKNFKSQPINLIAESKRKKSYKTAIFL